MPLSGRDESRIRLQSVPSSTASREPRHGGDQVRWRRAVSVAESSPKSGVAESV
jgi:hypothetical protein